MHQEHNIPWNILASNVTFIRDRYLYDHMLIGWRPVTAYFPRNLPTQANNMNHFARSIGTTISKFAKTERAKYPEFLVAPPSGKIFSDELRDQFPEFLNSRNQHIKHWISRAGSDADLCEVVCTLLHARAIPSLLILAQHPSIQLSSLRNPNVCRAGFAPVALFALVPYILYNMAAATGTLQTGDYLDVRKNSLLEIQRNFSPYPSQTLTLREFFSNPEAGPYDVGTSPRPHHDLPRLREYLKSLFSLLYCFEVVVRECGEDPRWEDEVVMATWKVVGFKTKPVEGNSYWDSYQFA